MLNKVCSSCGKTVSGRLYPNNTCQGCYLYFLHGGTINPTPKTGEISYDNRGFVVCHICGRAYRRLGSHIRESHGLTISKYKELFGLCDRARTTESCYSDHMRSLAYKYDMPKMLLDAGMNTRIKIGEKKRLGKISRAQECIERSRRNKKNIKEKQQYEHSRKDYI